MTPRPLADAIWFSRCSPTEKLVLLCIGSHAKPGGGGAYPGIRRIQALTGVAKSTVQRTIALLVGRGYIAIVKHGNTMAANEYKINIGTLMEHEIDAPELRSGVGLLPAQAVGPLPAQGVPGGVPIRDTRVGRFDPEGGPTTGTEQSTNINNQQEEGEKLWSVAKAKLKAAMNPGTFETWIRPISTATLEGSNLVLLLPSVDFETAVQRQPLHGAVDLAAKETGISYEGIILRSKGASTTASTGNHSGPILRPVQPWRRSA